MKTPEEMAEEYTRYWWPDFNDVKTCCQAHLATRQSFLAGYRAAQDQLADVSKMMNSPEKPDGWISVNDRLPREGEEVLVFGCLLNAPKLLGVRHRVLGDQDWKYTWQGDGYIFNQDYVTHWMPLPKAPKEEA